MKAKFERQQQRAANDISPDSTQSGFRIAFNIISWPFRKLRVGLSFLGRGFVNLFSKTNNVQVPLAKEHQDFKENRNGEHPKQGLEIDKGYRGSSATRMVNPLFRKDKLKQERKRVAGDQPLEQKSEDKDLPKKYNLFNSMPRAAKEHLDGFIGIRDKIVMTQTAKESNIFFISMLVQIRPVYQLLQHVARGEQEEAEQMLIKAQQNRKCKYPLLTTKANVIDFSNRCFNNITAFQYALWAGDAHMWRMLRKYLPDLEAAKQLQEHEEKSNPPNYVGKHGRYFDFAELLNALRKYYNYTRRPIRFEYTNERLNNNFNSDEAEKIWIQEVGTAQSRVPAHIANEYCHPTRTLQNPQKDDTLPRCLKFAFFTSECDADNYNKRYGVVESKHWFHHFNTDQTNHPLGIFRSANCGVHDAWYDALPHGVKDATEEGPGFNMTDLYGVETIARMRTEERDVLREELSLVLENSIEITTTKSQLSSS